jgi:hypothetical protein
MKVADTDAHVCLGEGEVAVGDTVRLFDNVCVPGPKPSIPSCKKVFVADGSVVELLDEHYSIVRFPAGTAFKEGQTVEKAK